MLKSLTSEHAFAKRISCEIKTQSEHVLTKRIRCEIKTPSDGNRGTSKSRIYLTCHLFKIRLINNEVSYLDIWMYS